MSPQRLSSYPYPEDEFSRIDLTRAEGKAIRDGNNERQAAWERRQAIVSHPAFHMGQGDPLHDPVWGEQERGSMRPIEHGRDFLQDLVTGAKEAAGGVLLHVGGSVGQSAINTAESHQTLERDVRDSVRQAIEGVQDFVKEVGDWLGDRGEDIGRDYLSRTVVENAPGMAENSTVGEIWGKIHHRAGPLEGPVFQKDSAAWKERIYNLDQADQSVRRLTDGAYEYGTAATQAGQESRGLTDEAVELRDGIGGVNEAIAATPGHIAEVNASFAVTSSERLPEMIGQMGTLEDQTLATVGALGLLAAVPPMPSGSGGSSARPSGREAPRTETDPLAHDPRYNPSGGESWGHYFQAAYNLAKNGRTERERKLGRERTVRAAQILGIPVPTFAGGTAFAPGGMALVGEMGPELVNLPRGSQVIPNPRLGSEVTVNVTVEGSVVAERDLAQRIRQELIRTSRRTVDLGFVA